MIESEVIIQFLIKYPDFSQPNKKILYFIGNIRLKENFYNIRLHLPYFPALKNFKYKLFNGLDECKLKPFNPNIDIISFLENFSEYLDLSGMSIFVDTDTDTIRNKIEILEQICKLQIIKNCKIYTNHLNNKIKFDNNDGHYLELDLKIAHNIEINVLEHSFPEIEINETDSTFKFLFNPSSTILEYYDQFNKLFQSFELFYKYLNVIDELCFVCAPHKPTTKDDWRLFKLNEQKCFIKIKLNALCPDSVQVDLYGPTIAVEKYREMYSDYAPKWDLQIDVYNNLLKAFDLMYFPMKRADQMEIDEESDEVCNICLSYYLEGQIPICSCDNLKCGLVFHVFCLKKWFATSVDGKRFLNVTMGSCPFCKNKLSTSFQSLLDEN